ncbi:MAG TPA: type VI secretion system-associated FHA domain protein TagH [Steroidobacteraceae bacterium]|nr:type VI secretion system-associated FHA domain protein TagH [Steroidobacteraceae bacterium]
MALRLRVTGPQAARLGERVSRVFGVQGGRIGRATDNDWSLPDPERYLSGHHAAIEYRGGTWFVLDTSSNGTYVNDRPEPLGRDHAQAVTTGDRLRMGEYQFVVSVSPDNDFPPDVEAAAAYDPASEADFALATHGDLGAELDMKGLLSDPTPPPDHSSGQPPGVHVSDAYGQMVTVAMPARSAPRPTMQSVPTTSPGGAPQRQGGSLQAFCRGAGIDAATLAPEHSKAILTLAGQLIRELTLGLITGLQYRTEQTGRYQIEDTSTSPAVNNTFRMSGSVDEALGRLFAPHSTRFLTPLEAVRTSFADLRRHDQAMVIAMQDALAEYLKRLAPDQLEQQFGEVLNRSGPLPPNPRQKYWDMYAELYRVLAQMAPEGLPRAFAEEFSKAYQTATQELREKAKRPAVEPLSGRRAP